MFLNPLMLFGMTAVSVPIIIHLLNKRRFEKVAWAAMRFLRVSIEQNQRRIRIEDLILLLLRCLLIVLLVLALARPVVRSTAGFLGGEQVVAVIVLDNSYSMSMTDGVESRFDQARKAAAQIIESLPTGSSVALLLGSDAVEKAIAEPTFGLKFARETVQKAPLSDRGTNLLPSVRDAVETLKGRKVLRKEIYVITDGQSAGFAQRAAIRQLLEENKQDMRGHFILVGGKDEENLSLSDLAAGGDMASANVPLRFDVAVTNHGRNEAREVKLSLAIDDEPPSQESVVDSIPPGQTRTISMFATMRSAGFHTITAALPADHLPADDRRTVAVQVLESVKVLLVDGDPGRRPAESEVFFLRNALQPVSAEMREDYFIKVTTIPAGDVETTRLEDFDAVVLANVPDFSQAFANQLEQFVRRDGRGLMVFPGDRINRAFYNDELFVRRKLLPASIGEAHGDAKQDEKFFFLDGKALSHKVSSLWNDPSKGRPAIVRFFRAHVLERGDFKIDQKLPADQRNGPPQPILTFAVAGTNGMLAGKPAMVESAVGNGRVVLFASTADTAWNDLPVAGAGGIWVPLTQRILATLVQRGDERLNLKVGHRFTHRFSGELLGKDAVIVRPRRADDQTDDSRKIEMLAGAATLEYDRTDQAGPYVVSVPGMQERVRFAAHADANESRVDRVSPDALEDFGPLVHVIEWKSGMVVADRIRRDRIGTELWLPLAIMALVLATAETLLAQWFSRSK